MKKLPIGLSEFKKLIEGSYYYFDKTNFIDEIIKDGSEVKLFTRPRRFGKTLNMSMLKYFFDIKEAEENRKLFKNLYIEKTENCCKFAKLISLKHSEICLAHSIKFLS